MYHRRIVSRPLWFARALAALPLAVALFPASAQAEPQGTVGLTLGVAGVGEQHKYWDDTVFHLGLRGDVLFGRSKASDFAIGPYLEAGTYAFDDFQFGGGVSTLFPIHPALPLVASLGAYGRVTDEYGLEPGLTGQLFWGTRSYNYHSNYIMTAGLTTQFRYGLGDSHETAILIGAQVDLVALSLPFIFLYEAIAGPSPEAARITPEE